MTNNIGVIRIMTFMEIRKRPSCDSLAQVRSIRV
jgi:hypothetical protein